MKKERKTHLPTQHFQLNGSQNGMHDERKEESQLETDITITSMLGDGTCVPCLAHTSNHTRDTESKGDTSGDTIGQLVGLVISLGAVSGEATANDVVGKSDTGVNGQPVGDEVHQVLQDFFEVGVTGNGDGDGDTGGEKDPDETGNALRVATQDLESQGNGVDVGAVVGDDGQRQDHQTELAESTDGIKNSAQQTSISRLVVTQGVFVVSAVDGSGGHNGNTQELGEEKRGDQSSPGGEEDLATAAVRGLVDGVIGGITGPASGETIDSRTVRQARAELRSSSSHGEIPEITGVGEQSEDDHEDNEGRDPAVVLVQVNDLVSSEGDKKGADGDDQDACKSRNVGVHRIEKLGADDGVGGGPAQTGENVQKGNYRRGYKHMMVVTRLSQETY